MAVPTQLGSPVRVGVATPIFDDPDWVQLPGYSYDLAPDGSRFLIVRSDQKHSTTSIRMVESGGR